MFKRMLGVLPRGNAITPASWHRRHRTIVALAWLHVPALFVLGVSRGYGVVHTVAEVAIIAAFAAGANVKGLSQDARASLATLGLVTASGVLVHMSGGLIEMHFHFFVVVAVVALYQSWFPFLVAIAFVLVHHGVVGAADSTSVYNHAAALAHPWRWATVHALFIAGESAAALTAWKLNEHSIDSERAARAELEGAVADLTEAQALTHIGTWDWEVGTDRLQWSEETYRICGVGPEDVPTYEGFIGSIQEDEREEVRSIIDRAVETGADLDYEAHLVRPDGTVRLIRGTGHVVEVARGVARLAGTIQDVTERKQALHDPLTGLPNRTLFLDRVDHARTQQQRDHTTLALLFVDLDDFKAVNDTKGHLVGDDLLREAGTRIGATLRPGDTLARLGGDEFVILLNGVEGVEDVTAVADRILSTVASTALDERIAAGTTASIGIAIEPAPGARSAAELLRDADIAMYAAKRTRKGTWELFDVKMRQDLRALQTLRGDLRRAMEQDEFFLRYQPILRLDDGTVDGAEALVRWQHPDRGVVPPLEFISVAEETGQIAEIGRWVLRRACADAARWQERTEGRFRVSVNVSPRELRDPGFARSLADTLAEFAVRPETLVLELTEGLLTDPTFDRRLEEISALGVQLAIDDFGSGSSSIGSLHRFPIDRLKVDKVLVDELTGEARASTLARAIVRLGRMLEIDVVAEGVEREDQLEMLRELRCPMAQGYLFAQPTDVEGIDALLAGGATSQAASESEPLPAVARRI